MGDVALEKGADLFVKKGWIYLMVRLLGFQVNLPPFLLAKKYSSAFEGGVIYHTNSRKLAS